MGVPDVLNVAVGAFSALAASGAWRTAAAMTRIERERRHSELVPKFRCTVQEGLNGVDRHGRLLVELVGPPGLDGLDEVTVRICDEVGREHPGSDHVWGPWRFNTGDSVHVVDERSSRPHEVSLVDGRNWMSFSLVRTEPPGLTQSPESWRREQAGPVRLAITCRRRPYEPWHLLYEVPAAERRPAVN
ncbi:hypothetical protein [Thermomonospora cellulosilytica]|uniref:Uncharacterized protein n=1 Tax=Thermomonospora cellulosilytica TaxID=1411118 RepID=A0A7W3MVL6_9ACTN|nr:hypothetical protein [Thermomonospora cellulosilytica]MBA9002705.1 hypothetical protein [Thermomonospora cellulosilytica]